VKNKVINLNIPSIIGNELKYIKECLDEGWVSSAGQYVDLFEKKVKEYVGSKYAIACVNGTSALQISLRLAGVSSGDEVIVPTLTFIASINAISYNNASPIFMDCDEHYNLDIEKTIDFIKKETVFNNGRTINKKTKKRVSAIMPVHVWGNGVLIDDLQKICNERKIKIVEDASESLGTFIKNKNNNIAYHSGTKGELGCISFNGNKIITTGGGGMIITDNSLIAKKAKYYTTQAKDDNLNYIHNEIGYNFRLTNIQSAMGVAQMELLPIFLKRKIYIYNQYVEGINKIKGLRIAKVPSHASNNHWMTVMQINKKKYGKDRKKTMKLLKSKNIESRPVWGLNHLQKPYKKFQNFKIEKALKLLDESLCLPSSSNQSEDETSKIIKILNG
jgi:perosamine synthetase